MKSDWPGWGSGEVIDGMIVNGYQWIPIIPVSKSLGIEVTSVSSWAVMLDGMLPLFANLLTS